MGDQPSPTDGPLTLDSVEYLGATRFGRPIVQLLWVLDDGSRGRVDLPTRTATDPALTPMQAAVLQVIDEMTPTDTLTNEEVAGAAGYANSDKLRAFMRDLATAGRVRRTAKGWQKVK